MQQITEDEYVQNQILQIKGAMKQNDRHTFEQNLRSQYREMNGLPNEINKGYTKGKKGNNNKQYRENKQEKKQPNKPQHEKYEYKEELARERNNYHGPVQQKQVPQKQEHYKQTRNTRHLEKHIRSALPNHQQDFGNQKTKKKFGYYENRDFDEDFNRDQESFDSEVKGNYKPKNNDYRNRQNNRGQNKYDDYGLHEYEEYKKENKRDNKNGKQYKKGKKRENNTFEKYWTEEQLAKGKAENDIFEGIFIANEFTREKGTIKCPIFKKKVHVNSFAHANRALHGCLVQFKVIEIRKGKDESEDEEEEIVVTKPTVQQKVEQVEDNEEDWEDMDSDEEKSKSSEPSVQYVERKKIPLTKLQQLSKAQLIGKIVGIVKNPFETRSMVGRLDLREKGKLHKFTGATKEELVKHIEENYYVSFKSVNKRSPWFNVDKLETFSYELDKEEPIEKFIDYLSQRYFAAKYVEWLQNSRYPKVKILKEVGVAGNIEVESEAILTENSVYDNDFSEQCKQELKVFSHDTIKKEMEKRLNLTKEYICSIDPVTARDLDDALSINKLDDGTYEIGVHIADVSHFVEANTEIDKEATLRTTSVYLVHKVIPMLPRMLCEELCSLNRDVERLAFSVFFCITSDGEVLWDRFRASKSVIKSCAQLSYDIVNQVIQGEIEQFSQGEERYKVAEGFDEKILKEKILLLNEIAQKRRQKRLEGSLTFDKSKLRFQLGADLFPTGYSEEKRGQAQFMVEEWMLLANQFVGKKLVEYDTRTAVLRQHVAPKPEKIEYYKNLLIACGLNEMAETFNVSTARLLKETLNKVQQIENEEAKHILAFRLIRLMEAALYFVVDNTPMEEWRHYALDFDVYTHFTSPIRRYPDILVHRRLQIALENQEIDQTGETRDKLKAIMDHCNECKLNARRVSDQCDQLFLALLLKSNPVEVDGYILSVGRQNIEVIIPKFNLERKIEYKNLKVPKFTVDEISENKYELVISYPDKEDPKGLRLFFIKQLQRVTVRLSGTDTFPIEYLIQVKIPNQEFI